MRKLVLVPFLFLLGYPNLLLAQSIYGPRLEQSASCFYQGKLYPSGSTVNINGKPYQCVDGQWIPL